MAAVRFVRRYCPLCFHTPWLSSFGKCQILSFTLSALSEQCVQWVPSMHISVHNLGCSSILSVQLPCIQKSSVWRVESWIMEDMHSTYIVASAYYCSSMHESKVHESYFVSMSYTCRSSRGELLWQHNENMKPFFFPETTLATQTVKQDSQQVCHNRIKAHKLCSLKKTKHTHKDSKALLGNDLNADLFSEA